MSGLEKASTILKIVAGAAFLAASAIASFHTAWSVGVAAGAIAVGIAAIVASMATASAAAKDMQKNIEAHANGGLATKGSLFIAGEAGPELVTKTSGGNSTIMNMQQLNEAVRLGFIGGLKSKEFSDFKDALSKMIATTTPMAFMSKGLNKIFGFANGGLADKGSLFYAGEAGPELVTQTSGGGSTIMNMKQLEDAVARGFIRGFASTDNGYDQDDTTEIYVDGQRLFNIMRSTAKRNGFDFVKV
jgi:predicted hotdog family 3-hydroxylacyl-ACP dehydratase